MYAFVAVYVCVFVYKLHSQRLVSCANTLGWQELQAGHGASERGPVAEILLVFWRATSGRWWAVVANEQHSPHLMVLAGITYSRRGHNPDTAWTCSSLAGEQGTPRGAACWWHSPEGLLLPIPVREVGMNDMVAVKKIFKNKLCVCVCVAWVFINILLYLFIALYSRYFIFSSFLSSLLPSLIPHLYHTATRAI